MKTIKILSALFTSVLLFTNCSDNDDTPVIINEEEVITKIVVTLTPTSAGQTITLQSTDIDGDGPTEPIVTSSGNLAPNTVYNASIDLFNETVTPAELLNEEIETEDEEHQFFYQITNNLATFSYVDFDANNKPIGLDFTVTTTATTGSGNLTITLRHMPYKSAAGVSDGNITNAGGETDLQAVFPITVQ